MSEWVSDRVSELSHHGKAEGRKTKTTHGPIYISPAFPRVLQVVAKWLHPAPMSTSRFSHTPSHSPTQFIRPAQRSTTPYICKEIPTTFMGFSVLLQISRPWESLWTAWVSAPAWVNSHLIWIWITDRSTTPGARSPITRAIYMEGVYKEHFFSSIAQLLMYYSQYLMTATGTFCMPCTCHRKVVSPHFSGAQKYARPKFILLHHHLLSKLIKSYLSIADTLGTTWSVLTKTRCPYFRGSFVFFCM